MFPLRLVGIWGGELQDEAKKYRGVAGVDQSLLDVANWEVVPTQVWGPEDTDQFVRARPGAAK